MMRSVEDLVDSLIATTEANKLGWEQDHGRYMAQLPRHRIQVWQWTDEDDGSSCISVQLLSKTGDLLDYVTADQYKPLFGKLERLLLLPGEAQSEFHMSFRRLRKNYLHSSRSAKRMS